ncbi:MAG: transcription termination factor Rho [Gemmataceae bacterium]
MTEQPRLAQGVLELHHQGGYGFLRDPARSFATGPTDIFVPAPLIKRHALREGLLLAGFPGPPQKGTPSPKGGPPSKGGAAAKGGSSPRLDAIEEIEGRPADQYRPRTFEDLTPIDPHEPLRLETGQQPLTTRVMDLLTPIGKGTRGLIVAPPRTGKTVLLQHIAHAVATNHPDMELVLLLVDERPEEVTEMRRLFRDRGHAEVIASSSDRDSVNHARTAELVVERAKRLAEQGRDVFVLLDSLTRLARAYNRNTAGGGRTLTGGVDARALDTPKRLFGSARVFEEGGSLTVLGTALIDTGSRMDEVIFQEFKGTGNMELVLDRKLADRRVFPALDISQSGTRKEERLLAPDVLQRVTLLRRTLVQMDTVTAMQSLVEKMARFESNAAFLDRIGPKGG